MTPLSMFSWGYSGWGSATPQLKKAVDVVERARQYEPPFFVDIRMKRSGRAAGFQDTAFEKVMGKNRYRWMRALGNKKIRSAPGRKFRSTSPKQSRSCSAWRCRSDQSASEFIFFCQCPEPGTTHNPSCHRVVVASALLKVARQRNVDLTISEWPGGASRQISREITDSQAESILRGRRSLPLGRRLPAIELLGLPWDSIVQFHSPAHSFRALADAARFTGGQWLLPIPFGAANETDGITTLAKRAERDRRLLGVQVRRS